MSIDPNAPAFPWEDMSDTPGQPGPSPGMTIRAYLARHTPSDEIQEFTFKHLSIQAQERLAGMQYPPRDSGLSGEERITAQIEGMKFHARVNAALRVIAADALIAELNRTTP